MVDVQAEILKCALSKVQKQIGAAKCDAKSSKASSKYSTFSQPKVADMQILVNAVHKIFNSNHKKL